MLRTVDWYLLTDVSEQAVGSHFKGSAVQQESALKMGPTGFSEMLLSNDQSSLGNIPAERRYQTVPTA
jgi:hypothetical protein